MASITATQYAELLRLAYSTYKIEDGLITKSDFTVGVFGDIAEEIVRIGFPFSPLHIEPLLDQAQELLNRSLQDRKIFNESSAQAFQISLELEEFSRLDTVHETERQAGAYTIERDKAYCDRDSENALSIAAQSAYTTLQLTNQLNASQKDGEIQLRAYSAYVNAAAYFQAHDGPSTGYSVDFTGGNINGKKPEVSRDIEQKLAEMDVATRNRLLDVQTTVAEGARNSSNFRVKKASQDAAFLEATVQTKEDRLQISRDLNAKKMAAVTTKGGPLNYAELATMARRRFVNNLSRAYQRLVAASNGLEIIYGFDDPVPSYRDYGVVGEDVADTFLDACWVWTQNAINAISLIQRGEQNAVFQISVKELVGPTEFAQSASSNKWEFTVDGARLGNGRVLRLRGVGVSVLADEQFRTCGISIVPPDKPIYIKEDGSQIGFPDIMARTISYGRVLAWTLNRDSDIFGVVSLHNWGPLGTWKLSFDKNVPVADIYIDFHVAMISSL